MAASSASYAVELTPLGRERLPPLLAAMRQVEAEVHNALGVHGRQELHPTTDQILRSAPGAVQ